MRLSYTTASTTGVATSFDPIPRPMPLQGCLMYQLSLPDHQFHLVLHPQL